MTVGTPVTDAPVDLVAETTADAVYRARYRRIGVRSGFQDGSNPALSLLQLGYRFEPQHTAGPSHPTAAGDFTGPNGALDNRHDPLQIGRGRWMTPKEVSQRRRA